MVTHLIQPEAPLTIEPGRPSSPARGDNSQGSFATALQSAVNSDSPVKAISLAKPETQPKSSVGEKGAQSLQQMVTPVTVPLAPAPSLPGPKVQSSAPPFTSLPGKVGRGDVTQTEDSESSTTSDVRRQPTTITSSFPVRSLGATWDPRSATPPKSSTPAPPGSAAGAPKGFANPADPLMRLTQTPALALPIRIAATAVSGNELQPPVFPAGSIVADPSNTNAVMTQPASMVEPVCSQISNGPAPEASALMATRTDVASGSQINPVEITPEQATALVVSPDVGTVTALPATGLQPPANLPVASKPPRVLNTEARKIGELPLRDLIPADSTSPQVSRVVSKVTAPAQFKTGAAALTVPAADSANSPGSHVFQTQDDTANQDRTAPKGKTPVAGGQDAATPLASAAADSPVLQRQIDPQPDNLPAASPLSVIPTSTDQNPGGQVSPSPPAESPAPHLIQTSVDAATTAASAVQTARVVQGVAQSEMHIGFRSAAFGIVEVHTAVRDTQLGLAVSSERGDLRGFLAQEVPALQTVFHQQGLQFDQIRFVAPGAGTGTGFSGGSNSNSNSPENGRSPRSWFSQAAALEPDTTTSQIQISTTRLSVHA